MSNKASNDIDPNSIFENLDYFTEDVENLLTKATCTLKNLHQYKAQTTLEIQSKFKEVKQTIIEKENELLADNDEEFSRCDQAFQERIADMRRIAIDLGSLQETAKKMKESKAPDMTVVQHINSKYEALFSKFMDLQGNKICPVLTTDIQDYNALDGLNFGKLEMSEAFEDELSENVENNLKLSEPFSFWVHRSADIKASVLTSLVWVNKHFIAADKSNKKVKVFDEDGVFIHELLFPKIEPYGICFILNARTMDQFAVTFPKVNTIILIEVSPNGQCQAYSNFNTVVGYSGVCRGIRNQTLIGTVVSNTTPPRIDIINTQGTVLQIIDTTYLNYGSSFVFPRYVLTNGDLIVVSDYRANCVFFIRESFSGNHSVASCYCGTPDHKLVNPLDITVDDRGLVYILDGKTGHIHVIDDSFNQIDVITSTSDLLNPRLLAHESHSERLAVTRGAGDIGVMMYDSFMAESGYKDPDRSEAGKGLLMPPTSPHDLNMRSPSPGF